MQAQSTRRGHCRTPSAPPALAHLQRREFAVSSTRGPPPPPVSFVTLTLKRGLSTSDMQLDGLHRVTALQMGSPASDAGLRVGDRILKVDNQAPAGVDDLLANAAEEMTIEVERGVMAMAPNGSMAAPPLPPVPSMTVDSGRPANAAIKSLEEAPTASSQAMWEIDLLDNQPMSMRDEMHQPKDALPPRHARRASAPPGFEKLAAVARASLGMPTATGETPRISSGKLLPSERPDGALRKLRGWWTERQRRQQAASGKGAVKPMLPMPAFLEDAFSTDSLDSFGSLDDAQISHEIE